MEGVRALPISRVSWLCLDDLSIYPLQAQYRVGAIGQRTEAREVENIG